MATKAQIIKKAKTYGVTRQKAPQGFSVSQMCDKYLELLATIERRMTQGGLDAQVYGDYLIRQAKYINDASLITISNHIDTFLQQREPLRIEDAYLPENRLAINRLIAKARGLARKLQASG